MSKTKKSVPAKDHKPGRPQKKLRLHHRVKKSFNDRHPFVVPLVTIGVLLFGSVVTWVFYGGQSIKPTDARIINFHQGDIQQIVPSRASTVKEFLERADIKLEEGDIIEPAISTPITTEEFTINLYRAKRVTITDENGNKKIVKTAQTIPEVIAKEAGYKLNPEDAVEVISPNDAVENGVLGTEIFVDKAKSIKLVLYGQTYDIRTRSATVSELATERNIPFDKNSILPAPNTRLTEGQSVFVTLPGKTLVSGEEVVPRGEKRVEDGALEAGKREVRDEGSDGKKAIVFEVLPSGEKKYLQEIILVQPVDRIIAVGISPPPLPSNYSVSAEKIDIMAAAGISPSDYAAVDYIISRESGWRPGAGNASSGAYGLCQALPASKMSSAGADYMTNPVTQLRWCSGYAVSRYGSWLNAYNFWVVSHWW